MKSFQAFVCIMEYTNSNGNQMATMVLNSFPAINQPVYPSFTYVYVLLEVFVIIEVNSDKAVIVIAMVTADRSSFLRSLFFDSSENISIRAQNIVGKYT